MRCPECGVYYDLGEKHDIMCIDDYAMCTGCYGDCPYCEEKEVNKK